MYKIIACDMDETLLGSDRRVSRRNRDAIQEARKRGVKFVPATGRGYRSLDGILDEIGLRDLPEEYVISFNGAAITENRGSRMLRFEEIPFELVEEIYRRAQGYDVGIHVYLKERVLGYRINADEDNYLAGRMAYERTDERDLSFLRGEKIVKILCVNTNHDYLARIAEDWNDLARDLDVSYSSNRYLEFNRKGATKGTGLLWLAEHLGVRPEETMAIGDNFNDRSMILAAGMGVCVANAVEELKAEADAVTESTNDEGAVAEAIERFILNAG